MIRAYTSADWLEVKSVFIEHIPEEFAPHELGELESYLKEKAGTYFVLLDKGKIVGAGGYHIEEPGLARLSWYFICKKNHGKGVGRRLVQHALNRISELQEIKKICVWTSQRAAKFFEKFDFKVVRTEKDYWAEGLDLYLMEKN